MRISFAAILVVCAAIVTSASAQSYGTDLIHTHGSGVIVRTALGGGTTTIGTGVGGTSGLLNMLALDTDNRTLVIVDTINSSPGTNEVIRVDSRNGAVLGTAWSGTPLSLVQSWLEVDQDGDYVVADGNGGATGGSLFKIDRNGFGLTTILNYASGYPFSFTQDLVTGDWIIGDLSSGAIMQFDYDTNTLVTMVSLPGTPVGMRQDPLSNEVIVAAGNYILGYDAAGNTLRTIVDGSSTGYGPNAFEVDRSPGASGAFYYSIDARPSSGGITRSTRGGRILGTWNTGQRSGLGLVFDRSNNLGRVLVTGPNNRGLRVSFPNSPGKGYVVGFSLTASTPGIPLSDGRIIPLAPDNLTIVTAQQPLPPLITNNIGTLDANGEAAVGVNANPLGTVTGIRLWATAIVLDPAQSLGIAEISKPVMFVLD